MTVQQPTANTLSTAPPADKYRLKDRPREESPVNEIRVTNTGGISVYLTYAHKLLLEENKETITVRGSGLAIRTAVCVVEILKHRVKGLHQQTNIGTITLVDEYVPLVEGMEAQSRSRKVPYLQVILSKSVNAVDTKAPGYTPPIDEALVTDFRPSVKTGSYRRPRGGRRGGRVPRQTNASGPTTETRDGTPADVRRGGRGGRRGGLGRGARRPQQQQQQSRDEKPMN